MELNLKISYLQVKRLIKINTYHLKYSVKQAFANYVQGYDSAPNVHANGVTHARTFVHDIEFSV